MARKSIQNDEAILQLNALGLSTTTIGKELGCHPTTVVNRLKAMGAKPVDTRQSFMDKFIAGLTPQHRMWLLSQIKPPQTISDVFEQLIAQEYLKQYKENK